ncbi:MAG: oligosaccharide repeat unit polymerase [Clostridium sp.]|uniref:oligosaccharide repeat unit polymerase n=1 Tax=Clostridium sp. TaxID=1506 RepID=UPI002914F38B|nr:oligosaccharide repeat unit polymerase [Clostridium sp.]MDU7337021.1 oligosaccharide repeat unit polymerase [Clostridium sp.]
MIWKELVVVLGLIISLILFHKASATLNVGKINLLSYIMYLFLLQTYIGAALVYLGDRNHYTMKYITVSDSYDLMFYSVLLSAILFPLTIILLYRCFHVDIQQRYKSYLKKTVEVKHEQLAFYVLSGIGFICCVLLLLYIIKIGYFPLLRLVRTPAGFEFGVERQRISQIVIINSYVKNLLLGLFLPLLSYISFAYAVVLKKFWWWALTAVLVGSSIVSATINFEKSPVLFYLFVLLLILMYERGGISRRTVFGFGAVMALFVVFIYGRMGYSFTSGDSNFYNGPIGRTIFTQVGTLTMHFDLFPTIFPFLGGRSFSPTAMQLLGIEGGHVRSAKLVMDFYGSEKVYDGTGGVMNAFYIGEAYANFGFWGMVLSIVYMGVLLGLLFYAFTRLRKTPYQLALTAMLTSRLALTTQGGFVDFIYNFQVYVLLFLLVAGHFAPYVWERLLPRMPAGVVKLIDKLDGKEKKAAVKS